MKRFLNPVRKTRWTNRQTGQPSDLAVGAEPSDLTVGGLQLARGPVQVGASARGVDLDPLALELLGRLRREAIAERGEDLRAAVEQQHPRRPRVDVVDVAGQ